MIAYLAADLMWDSRIRSTAAAAGLQARRIRSWSDLQSLLTDAGVRMVLIDLEAEEADEVVLHGSELKAAGIRTLAWAAHVNAGRLDLARRAGIDEVLARGAFARRLEEIVASAGGS